MDMRAVAGQGGAWCPRGSCAWGTAKGEDAAEERELPSEAQAGRLLCWQALRPGSLGILRERGRVGGGFLLLSQGSGGGPTASFACEAERGPRSGWEGGDPAPLAAQRAGWQAGAWRSRA